MENIDNYSDVSELVELPDSDSGCNGGSSPSVRAKHYKNARIWNCEFCGQDFLNRKSFFQHRKDSKECHLKALEAGYKKGAEKRRGVHTKGHPCSKATKEILSKKAIEHCYWEHRSRNPIIYEGKTGKFNLDSYWELEVAKRLDEMNVEWYRPKVALEYIDNLGQKHFYCPDFYVKDYGCFIEVKSPYILQKQNKNGKIDYLKSHYDFIVWLESEDQCKIFELKKSSYSEVPERLVENFNHKIRSKKEGNGINVDLEQKRWEMLQNSNIDFSKYGWIKEAAKLFGIAENKAGLYIRNHYQEFYKTKCFCRKQI